MRSSCREDIVGRLDALHDVVSELLELSFDALTTIRDRRTVAAMAQRAGQIGAGYVAVIRRFVQQLPEWVDAATRDKAEAKLACQGAHLRPDELAKLADKLADCLNPDGNFTDEDRARRRGLILGNQQADGMSSLSGWLTPAARPSSMRCGLDLPLPAWPPRPMPPCAWTARPAKTRRLASPAQRIVLYAKDR